ncbi:hypothetical protein [Neisseria animalis]|uniref:hypothetical protein n=1 Tax=Neisseria animalis TaxID=492 RepID=UPI0013BEA13D|nr:hypothetical protein [Neisseria animalis]
MRDINDVREGYWQPYRTGNEKEIKKLMEKKRDEDIGQGSKSLAHTLGRLLEQAAVSR